ncbi:MAG: C40 family peptidase [Nocardioidaceae bacterium]
MTTAIHLIGVDVATGWTAPDAPREIDAPAVADKPDIRTWTAAMTTEDRMGLHGRTLTQLVADEPVEVIEESGDWVRVVAPWQPDPADARGYPSWVRRSHLRAVGPGAPPAITPPPPKPPSTIEADRLAIIEYARRFIGLHYLWGGTCKWGLDCSGLVHYAYRQAGVVIPRDAHVQQTAAVAVPLGAEQPGDLYFFAGRGGGVTHVGFVTGERHMLHAPQADGQITDEPLPPHRAETLVAAGRFRT